VGKKRKNKKEETKIISDEMGIVEYTCAILNIQDRKLVEEALKDNIGDKLEEIDKDSVVECRQVLEDFCTEKLLEKTQLEDIKQEEGYEEESKGPQMMMTTD
jgi:hypothetical protein